MSKYTETGRCTRWGGRQGARVVTGLTKEERAAIRAGEEIRLAGAPAYQGVTERRIVEIRGRFYCRMPI
jgi:hypothetical protein